MTMDQSKIYLKKKMSFLRNLWTGNYLQHLIGVKDISFIKYCIATGPTERLKIHPKNII